MYRNLYSKDGTYIYYRYTELEQEFDIINFQWDTKLDDG